MFTTHDFIAQFRKETYTCLHLFASMPPGGLDYRPTLGQRSTLELLRYLCHGPYNGVLRTVAGDWTVGVPTAEATSAMPASDFPRRMGWQLAEVERIVLGADPNDLMTKDMTYPWGDCMKRGRALVAYPLNWLASYRMQLFLYLKAAGAALATPDLWQDKGPKQAHG